MDLAAAAIQTAPFYLFAMLTVHANAIQVITWGLTESAVYSIVTATFRVLGRFVITPPFAVNVPQEWLMQVTLDAFLAVQRRQIVGPLVSARQGHTANAILVMHLPLMDHALCLVAITMCVDITVTVILISVYAHVLHRMFRRWAMALIVRKAVKIQQLAH